MRLAETVTYRRPPRKMSSFENRVTRALEFIDIPIAVCLSSGEREYVPRDALLPGFSSGSCFVIGDGDHDDDNRPRLPDPDVLCEPLLTLGACCSAKRVLGIEVVHGFKAEIVQVAAHPPELRKEVFTVESRDRGQECFLGRKVEVAIRGVEASPS